MVSAGRGEIHNDTVQIRALAIYISWLVTNPLIVPIRWFLYLDRWACFTRIEIALDGSFSDMVWLLDLGATIVRQVRESTAVPDKLFLISFIL